MFALPHITEFEVVATRANDIARARYKAANHSAKRRVHDFGM